MLLYLVVTSTLCGENNVVFPFSQVHACYTIVPAAYLINQKLHPLKFCIIQYICV